MLDNAKISYQLVNHPAVLTAQEADRYVQGYEFARTKNLFLKANNDFYLVIVDEARRLDMKRLRRQLGTGRLSFAKPDDLQAQLGVTTGAVSPFNLLNNLQHNVNVVIDQAVIEQNTLIGCHPNDNTQTVILKIKDLLTLINECGNPLQIITLSGE